ncbi:MAG: hypothetical protein ACOVLC_01010 [Flavobacterium sp.]
MKKLVFSTIAIFMFSLNGLAFNDDSKHEEASLTSQECTFCEEEVSAQPDNCFYSILTMIKNEDGTWSATLIDYSTYALSAEDCVFISEQHARRAKRGFSF